MTIQKNYFKKFTRKKIPISDPRIKRLITRSIEFIGDFPVLKKIFNGKKNISSEITIRFTDEIESKQLNKTYRKKHYPTNVLTFTYDHFPTLIADIVLCIPIIEKECSEKKIKFDHHIAHLIVHGTLHAAGFDHNNEETAKIMENLEIIILKRFNISNPYTKN